MKKTLSILCTAVMFLSLAGCARQTDLSGQTITGQVTAINGSSIILQLGELAIDETAREGGFGQRADKPTDGEEVVTLDFSGAEIKIGAGAQTAEGTPADIAADTIVIVEVGPKTPRALWPSPSRAGWA